MALVVGVAFKRVARSYWFSPGDISLKQGDRVVVETTRGVEIGFVRVPPREIDEDALQAPLKRVYRIASPDDLRQEERNLAKVDRAITLATERIRAHDSSVTMSGFSHTGHSGNDRSIFGSFFPVTTCGIRSGFTR